MLKQIEFVSWVAAGIARNISNATVEHATTRAWADKCEEFVLRLHRAGLLFLGIAAAVLVLLITHPIGLLLGLVALALAGFGSLVSMFWPTRRFAKRRLQDRAPVQGSASTARLTWRRVDIPVASRSAFDLVTERVQRSQTFAGAEEDLLAKEAERLINQHLPRLMQSFLALPAAERNTRSGELTEGLLAIAEELGELNQRLLSARTDRFETERRFIANRYPRRSGLAAL